MWWLPSAHASTFMPPAVSEIGQQVDHIYGFLLIASLISFILLVGGMIYFVMKYKRQSASDKTAYITHNHFLEFLWSFIPFVIFMFVFGWGWYVYHQMRHFPENAIEVHVVAKKWNWTFIYKNGKTGPYEMDPYTAGKEFPVMVVPVGKPVKLIMASQKVNPDDKVDRAVLHSFYIPALRIKQDVVPGRYTSLWFQADKLGLYNVFCAEYCGTSHSGMRAFIKVVTPEQYEQWLASGDSGNLSIADKGKALFQQKACAGCHSIDGTRLVGPSIKGLWGRAEELEGGGTANVDENYIRESILEPNAKIVKSYPTGLMPTYKGQLSDEEISALIEYIKSVK